MVRGRQIVLTVGAMVLSLVALAACSDQPEVPADRLDRAALVHDIDAQLSINTISERLRAVLVIEHGKPVFEKYYDTTPEAYWSVEEITQVVTSTLVGIAIREGRISGLDATLADLLPTHADDMSPGLADTTLGQLLSMTAGFPPADHDRIWSYVRRKDPVGTILRKADQVPFRAFEYSTHGAHLVSAVLAHATGTSVLDYARSRLFDPLGIDTRSPGFAWPVDRSGLNLGWSRLRLRPADLAKLGQLYLDDGAWRGRQLLPASWVGRATSEQALAQDIDSGYGYGWWVRNEAADAEYYAWGYGGQLLEVVPGRDIVVVIDSRIDRVHPGNDGPADLTFLVDHVILPAVTG